MNAVAKTEAAPRTSLIATMAAKYQMDADQFAKTVRATVMPAQHTNEQFAALMLVANEYDLNPVVKEIYAFPAKGGGIVPIVSIDGWVNLVNSHPACDGFEFEFEHDDQKKLISCTCRMYRKDRGRPVTVTEYLSECKRNTDPWKMEHRMLRHKAMIQAARYAFGFSGIYDEDEGSKIAEMRDVTPPKPPQPPEPPTEEVSGDGGDILDLTPEKPSEEHHGEINADEFIDLIKGEFATAQSAEDLEEVWTARDPMAVLEGDDVRQGLAIALKNKNLKRLGASS